MLQQQHGDTAIRPALCLAVGCPTRFRRPPDAPRCQRAPPTDVRRRRRPRSRENGV